MYIFVDTVFLITIMFYLNQVLDKYQVFLYLFYQTIYRFLRISSGDINFALFPLLVSMGILTVLTPCFISMFPILFTYINSTTHKTVNILIFIFGIMNSILITFLISSSINLYSFFYHLPLISSLILIVVALNLMKIVEFSLISKIFYSRLDWIIHFNINLQSYFMGLVIGLGSTPCNTSIIVLLVFLLKHTNNTLYLSFYLFTYLFGCFLILLVILNLKIDKYYFTSLILLWNSFIPLSGSLLFICSLLLLLRKSFL